MPLPCANPRYRYRKGTHTRLAFCGNTVVEAKNAQTGAVHTPGEFAADRERASMRHLKRAMDRVPQH